MLLAVRRLTLLAVTAITLFGAFLRIDALTVKYGWLDHPPWVARLERALQPLTRHLRPASVPWAQVAKPYIGGDPVNYIRFAREMRHFYQAHVREPVFLALTRFMLWMMDGRDVAVSFASALAGTLAIPATYLLGAAASSRATGFIAAGALAIDLYAVTWAVDGWRDDTFMLFVALSAWAFVRLQQQPTAARGVIAGVTAAAACLTRISSLSFVVPALLWIWARATRSDWRVGIPALVAACVTLVLVAPFLINCWRVTGDPFFAINYHTRYYRAAEGLPADESVGAAAYLGKKLRERPIATIDTAAVGVFVFPFSNKWTGFDFWSPVLSAVLRWAAIAGLILAVWSVEGRLLWLILSSSLIPYAVTWPLGGGGEWRFTQHAYPFYLVAAGSAIVMAARALNGFATGRDIWPRALMYSRLRQGGLVAVLALGAWGLYVTAPYLVAREALAAGETVSITVGNRDRLFFGSRWSGPSGSGNVVVRVAMGDRVSVRLPLPRPVEHLLTFRMDPPLPEDPAYQPKLTLFLDNHTIGHVRFTFDPQRVGAYRIVVPAVLAGRSFSRLDFVASHTLQADQSGPRFAWLPGDTPVAFYLWYIRVEPRMNTLAELPSVLGARRLD